MILTREIVIHYHGKRIPTHILETDIQVQTVTSTRSSIVEITPTPTWQTITITPTVTQPPPPSPPPPSVLDINQLLASERQEEERLGQRDDNDRTSQRDDIVSLGHRFDQVGDVRRDKAEVVEIPKALDSFESLKKYLENIQNHDEEELPTIIAEPLVSIQSTSVSTVYLSGSVPGQYSTSLVTIILDKEGDMPGRKKRQILPSVHQPIMATRLPETGSNESFPEDQNELEILSSFGVASDLSGEQSEGECSNRTVTVTVTRTCSP